MYLSGKTRREMDYLRKTLQSRIIKPVRKNIRNAIKSESNTWLKSM